MSDINNTFTEGEAESISISASDTFGVNRLFTTFNAEIAIGVDIENTFDQGTNEIINQF